MKLTKYGWLFRAWRRFTLVIYCMVLVVGFITTLTGRAQVLYGSLTGNVTDPSGAAISSAAIEVTNVNTGIVEHAITNNNGIYLIQNLPSGTYTVTISAASFAKAVQTGVVVTENNIHRIDMQLQIGSTNQKVTVNGSAVGLQTDSANVSDLVTNKEINTLPTGTQRNYQDLYEILPGFSPGFNAHSGAGNPQGALTNNVNGVSYSNNVTLIDGASDIYPYLPETDAYVPPAESIGSMNVVTNSFNADQGNAGGTVINLITKSGTNRVHGSAWEYNTDSSFVARPYFFTGPVPKNILNQFGLAVGGPIIKSKLFYFADWERTDQSISASGFQTIATNALKLGDFAGTNTIIYDPSTGDSAGRGRTPFPNDQIPASRLNPAALAMAALLPEPNVPGVVANDYFITKTTTFLRDDIDSKIDYHPTENSILFARYSASPSTIFAPQALGAAGGNTLDGNQPGNAIGLIQLVTIGGNHTFTPNLAMDGTFGFTRQYLTAQNVDINKNYGLLLGIPGTNGPNRLQGGYPTFDIGGFSALGNPNQYNPFLFRDNQFVGALNLHWVRGKHSFAFGGNYGHYGINHFQPDNALGGPRGGFSFTGGLTSLNGGAAPNLYNGWADFLLGLPHQLGKAYQYIDPGPVRESDYGLYAEDTWQAAKNLTINYGIRYELYPYAHGDHYGGLLYNPDNNNIYVGGKNGVPYNPGVNTGHGYVTPRFGVNYRINDKTVIRAGFGVSTDPDNFRNILNSYPTTLSETYYGLNSYLAAGSLATGIPPLSSTPNLNQGIIPLPNNVSTVTYAPNFNRGYIQSYNAAVQRDMRAGLNLQVAYVGDRSVRIDCGLDLNAAGPGTGVAGEPLFQKYGNSNFITQYTPACPANYNALQTQLIRRVASGTQFGLVYTYSKAMDYTSADQGGLFYQWTPVVRRNYALSNFDRTHDLAFYGMYLFPLGKGYAWLNHGIGSAIAGGWELNGILTRMSGTPFTVVSSGASLNAPGNGQTANQVKPHVAILGGHGQGHPYFDPYAFAPVTTATFGTSSLSSVRGPGFFNLDANVKRTFEITHLFQLQFSAEALGLTNTPQFGNPNAIVSNATFKNGVITNFNNYDTITTAGGNRVLQFGLKLIY